MIIIPKYNLENPSYACLRIDKLSNGESLSDVSTNVELCYTKTSLIVNFINQGDFIQENNYETYNSEMWNQTVVELFIAPVALDVIPQAYVEIEVTPKGMIYASKITNADGTGKNNQHEFFKCTEIDFSPRLTSNLNAGYWSAQLTVPFAIIGGEGKSGQRFKANFFRVQMSKIGQGNCTPETCQYMAWRPTMATPPRFHIPQFFGDFVLQ